MTTKIINGKIILTDEILEGYSLYFADGVITAVTADDLPCDCVIDAAGQYVSPGFVDIHTHGAGGADFLDGTADAYRTAAKMHGDHGTTTLLPTTTSVDRDGILVAVKAYEEASDTPIIVSKSVVCIWKARILRHPRRGRRRNVSSTRSTNRKRSTF